MQEDIISYHIDQLGRVVELVQIKEVGGRHFGCTSRCRLYCMYYSKVKDLLGHPNPCAVAKKGPNNHSNCQTKYYKAPNYG